METASSEQLGVVDGPVFLSEEPAKPEGIHAAPASLNERPLFPLLMAGTATLTDLVDEYVLFTHGLVFTHGAWLQDPLQDYVTSMDTDCRLHALELPSPVFRWFDGRSPVDRQTLDTSWNRKIMACPKRSWNGLYRFLASIQGTNRDTKTMYSLAAQRIPIIDVIAFANLSGLPDRIPEVDCLCFALVTNRRTVYFAPERRVNPWDPVPVLTRNPETRMVAYAKAFFRNSETPRAGTLEPSREQLEAAVNAADNSTNRAIELLGKLDNSYGIRSLPPVVMPESKSVGASND
jgi:hypothetical protein